MSSVSKDHLIILMLSEDDGKALSLLQEIYGSELLALAYSMVEIKEEAEDILQEVYLNIWTKRHKIKLTAPIKNYLMKMVINACLDYFRQSTSRKNLESTIPAMSLSTYQSDHKQQYAMLKAMLNKTKASLPPRTRMAFILSRSFKMPYSDISKYMGISQKGVEKHITKALKVFRATWKEYLKMTNLILLPMYDNMIDSIITEVGSYFY